MVCTKILPSSSDLIWLYGKYSGLVLPGWRGFMEEATTSLSFHYTFVTCLPFINAPASDYDTIYTSLLLASEKCLKMDQKTCVVTFDQPLYMKAQYILANCGPDSKLGNVVVRLGGFHLMMSFLGSVGYLMTGSGLKELFHTVYAMNSIDKMMEGHAYSRALRAHFLAYVALSKIIMSSFHFPVELKDGLSEILRNWDKSCVLSVEDNEYYCKLTEKFEERLSELEQLGPTAKLWIQYLKMITLAKQFMEAERMGNWELHLDTIQKMLPFFFSSGHFFYAKSCQLYLQQMRSLKDRMPQNEYEAFTTGANFTIRRNNKFFSGTWTDMVIEQSLMKSMKSSGGLTRGRGISETVLTTWTLGTVYLQNICDCVETFCNVAYQSSEQHVELSETRINRDKEDTLKMHAWLDQHPPFTQRKEIMSISTGVVGNESINCHLAQELGLMGISKLEGSDFQTVKYKRNERCKPLGTMRSGITVDEETVAVDPLLIFRRICIAKKSEAELEKFLEYELSPFPLSIFNEEGLHKGIKSSLYKEFKPLADEQIDIEDAIYVIDGGFLLHRVVWPRNVSFSLICDAYIEYVVSKYTSNCVVVFDGYPDDAMKLSTKFAERVRRARKHSSVDIIFDESMIPTIPQEKFLSNCMNKVRLISMLKSKFESKNLKVRKAKEDADYLIIKTANEEASKHKSKVIIVGEDVDLLVLLDRKSVV